MHKTTSSGRTIEPVIESLRTVRQPEAALAAPSNWAAFVLTERTLGNLDIMKLVTADVKGG